MSDASFLSQIPLFSPRENYSPNLQISHFQYFFTVLLLMLSSLRTCFFLACFALNKNRKVMFFLSFFSQLYTEKSHRYCNIYFAQFLSPVVFHYLNIPCSVVGLIPIFGGYGQCYYILNLVSCHTFNKG